MKRIAVTAACSLAVLGAMVAPAQADTDDPGSAGDLVAGQTLDFFSTAIDLSRAEAAGNLVESDGSVARLIDGTTGDVLEEVPASNVYADRAAIEAAADSGSMALPLPPNEAARGVIFGNCGSSYLYMRDGGSNDNDFEFSTGFDLNGSAYDFDWTIIFEGPGSYGARWEDSGPMFPDAHWTSGWKSEYTGANGLHTGEVTEGLAFKVSGGVCHTAGPAASANAS